MADQNVDVTFVPPNPNSWVFDDQTVHMSAAGKINLHRKPASATWTFVTATGLPAGYTVTVAGNGSLLKIDDPHDPPYGVIRKYSVTVTDGTTQYVSPMQTASQVAGGPPPMIINDL
jgi:hypothetical protein